MPQPLLAIAAVVALAVGAVAWQSYRNAHSAAGGAEDARQIAVLAFDDNTPDGSFGWLANGLAIDLIDALSGSQALSLRSPEAVRPYRGATLDSVAAALRVGTVVSGSIDRVADSLRIRVRIADTRTGASIGPAIRIMAARSEIERARQQVIDSVAIVLRTALGDHVSTTRRWREAGSAEAWELLQRGDGIRLEALDRIRRGDLAAANAHLTLADSLLARAALVAPGWAEPLVLRGWVAEARATVAAEQPSDRCRSACIQWRRAAIAYASRALALNSKEVGALELRGTIHSLLHLALGDSLAAISQLDSAERDLRKAVELDSARARAWLSLARVFRGRADFLRADAATQRAVQADPWLSDAREALQGQMINALERSDRLQARRLCDAGRATYPDTRVFVECLLYIHGWLGVTRAAADSAARDLARIEALTYPPGPDFTRGYRRAMVAAVLARSGLADSARRVLQTTERSLPAGDPNWTVQRAFVELALGDTSAALRSLEQYSRLQPQRRRVLGSMSWFTGLHGHQRFQAIMGVPDDVPDSASRGTAR